MVGNIFDWFAAFSPGKDQFGVAILPGSPRKNDPDFRNIDSLARSILCRIGNAIIIVENYAQGSSNGGNRLTIRPCPGRRRDWLLETQWSKPAAALFGADARRSA
jgi:hypothetical protein